MAARGTEGARAGQGAAGDAFERIVAEYGRTLVAMASRLLGDPDAAQDVAQESFIRLSREWNGALEPSPSMTVWLRRTLHNICIDTARAATRRAALHESHARERGFVQHPDRGQGYGGDVPDAAAEADDALRILPSRERSLVVLKIYEGLSYREISAVTGIPEGTIGYLLHESMEKLAHYLRASRSRSKEAGK